MSRPRNPNHSPTPFGEAVCAKRKQRGWSQAELAERMGVTAGWVGLVETGSRGREPSPKYVLAVATVFNEPVEEWQSLVDQQRNPRPIVEGVHRSTRRVQRAGKGAPTIFERMTELERRLKASEETNRAEADRLAALRRDLDALKEQIGRPD